MELNRPKDNANTYKKRIGAWGEEQAAQFLIAQGLDIVCRNYWMRDGEIDIIAQENNTLVFVEVKTRASLDKGYPEEAVTQIKMNHLYQAAEKFAAEHPEYQNFRIDVIAIVGRPGANTPEIKWFRDANG